MAALSESAFERELRELCDSAYERPSPPNNPFLKLMEGTLTLEEARPTWGGIYLDIILILNQHTLPRLLERCPDIAGRVVIWQQIYPEYGGQTSPSYGDATLGDAHLTLYRTFLLALGVRPEECELKLDLEKPFVKKTMASIERQSFLELLASFLARETIGPKVFGLVANGLKRSFGLTDDQLRYFTVHHELDKEDSANLFPLVARYARTVEEQDLVRRSMHAWFDQERPRQYACKLGPIDWFYWPPFQP